MSAEACRVVRPDGRLVLYEFAKGPTDKPPYQSTRASGGSMSVVAEPAELRQLAMAAGFTQIVREDVAGPF